MTRYFIDTEFFDKGPNDLHLISIALVCDDGRELYLCDSTWLCADGTPDGVMADDWLRANVFPHLPNCKCPPPPEPIQGRPSYHRGSELYVHETTCPWRRQSDMRQLITDFVKDPGNDERVEFWAYFASFDWILFSWLFGKMINLPRHFQWLVHDLRVWATTMGYKGKFRDLLPDTGHHDALADARWNRDAHKILVEFFARDRVERAAMNIDKLVEAAKGHYKEMGLDPAMISAFAVPDKFLRDQWLRILTEEDL